ncbi:MAG TPA: response regulator [Burkholderiaceae bacterium]|nr:response regulator [Burkholderiaceae bacterium]
MALVQVSNTSNQTKPRAPHRLRVFVVENHADTREFLTFMLEELGHQVVVAETMTRALREVPVANCDVLISDIGLPDGDGWELLARLHLPRPIFAIAMSGFGMASDRNRSKAAGYRHHLVKPMGLEHLESILKEAAAELEETKDGEAVGAVSSHCASAAR